MLNELSVRSLVYVHSCSHKWQFIFRTATPEKETKPCAPAETLEVADSFHFCTQPGFTCRTDVMMFCWQRHWACSIQLGEVIKIIKSQFGSERNIKITLAAALLCLLDDEANLNMTTWWPCQAMSKQKTQDFRGHLDPSHLDIQQKFLLLLSCQIAKLPCSWTVLEVNS